MKINPGDIAYIAQLANLEVAEDEQEELAVQLSRIVEYVEKLNSLDTGAVEPTSQVAPHETEAGRQDRVEAREGSGDAAGTGLFRVPKVITER